MAKEKNYSKRLQEIEQSNPATLPKRFVDLERQRDKIKKKQNNTEKSVIQQQTNFTKQRQKSKS